MRLETVCRQFDALRAALVRKLRHLQARIAAGIDASEGLQIHAHVERKSMIGGAAPDANAEAGKLALIDVDARSALAAVRPDAKLRRIVDDGFLERRDEVPHAQARTLQVNERIDDELPGTVIGHLSAAIDLQHWNFAGCDEVRTARVHPQREDGGVLEKPDLIGACGTARGGKALHGMPGGFVVHAAKMTNDGRGDGVSSLWREHALA